LNLRNIRNTIFVRKFEIDSESHAILGGPFTQPSSRGVLCCGFSPDGRLLACGGSDWAVRLYDVATGQERAALEGHRGNVTACAFNGPTPCSDTR